MASVKWFIEKCGAFFYKSIIKVWQFWEIAVSSCIWELKLDRFWRGKRSENEKSHTFYQKIECEVIKRTSVNSALGISWSGRGCVLSIALSVIEQRSPPSGHRAEWGVCGKCGVTVCEVSFFRMWFCDVILWCDFMMWFYDVILRCDGDLISGFDKWCM